MDPTFNYDEIPAAYYDDVYRRHRGIQSKWHHMKFNFFQGKIGRSLKHLDLACGAGTFLAALDRSCTWQIGTDISQPQLREANSRYSDSNRLFIQSNVAKLPLKTGYFDLVSAIELIEHLQPDVVHATFQEAFRVLKPGGKLLLTTPNYRSLIVLIEPMIGWFSEVSYSDQHITKFNRTSLRDTLQSHGFEDVTVNGFMFSAPFLAFLGWNLPDKIAKLEPKILTNRLGLLLYASATKPQT